MLCQAQDIWEVPSIKTLKDYHLKGKGITGLYLMEYTAGLQERVLKDSTVRLDTILSRKKETNVTFNKQGYVTKVKVDSFDEKGKTINNRAVKYLYDKDKLIGIMLYNDDELTDSTHIEYNRKQEIGEQQFYDKKARLTKVVQYFYRYDRIFNIKVRNEKMELINFIRFSYTASGDIREQEIKGNTMQYLYSYKYSYDTAKDGTISINKYDYVGDYKCRSMYRQTLNKKGQVIETTVTDSNKRVVDYRTLKYNRRGDMKSQLIFTRFKYDYLYTYQYDKAGNWKTQWTFEKGVPKSKIHRVIEFKKED